MKALYTLTITSDDLNHAERLREVPSIRDFVIAQSPTRIRVDFTTRSYETLMIVWSVVSELNLPTFGDPENFDSFESRRKRVPIREGRFAWVTRTIEWKCDHLRSLDLVVFKGCGKTVHTDDRLLFSNYKAMERMQSLFSLSRSKKTPLLWPNGSDLLISYSFAETLLEEGFAGLSLQPISFTDGTVADPKSRPDLPLFFLDGESELPRMHPELDVREMRSGEPWTPEHAGSAALYSTATCPYPALYYERKDLDAIPPFDLAMTRERLFFSKHHFNLKDRERIVSQKLYRRLLKTDPTVEVAPVFVLD